MTSEHGTEFAWYDLEFRVRSATAEAVRYLASQHRLAAAAGWGVDVAARIGIHAVASAERLDELRSAPATEDRESFSGWWYHCHTDADGAFVLVSGAGHEFAHALRTPDFRDWEIVAGTAAELGLVATRAIREMVREHFLARGGLMLHGSAAVLPDGTGLVFAGASGAGKTSIAVQIAQAGGRCVATDRLFLLPEKGGPDNTGQENTGWVAVGLPLSTRLTNAAATGLGINPADKDKLIRHGEAAARRPDPKNKISLSNDEIFRLSGVEFAAATRINALVLLERDVSPLTRDLSPVDAESAFGEHLLVPDSAYRTRWLSPDPRPETADGVADALRDLTKSVPARQALWTPATLDRDVLLNLLTTTGAEPVPEPTIRHSARALLLDEQDRLLLFSSKDDKDGHTFWYPVGGGLKGDETPEQALHREVREETGLSGLNVGPVVWHRQAFASWGGNDYDCRDRFYLCRVPSFTIDTSGFTETELDSIQSHRWWTLDELAATTDRLVPGDLAERMKRLLTDGIPDEPEMVGK